MAGARRDRRPRLVVAGVPAALSLLAMATAGWLNTLAGVVAALTGPAA